MCVLNLAPTLCSATADSPGGRRAVYGRCAPGEAGSVTYPIGTEGPQMIDGANQPTGYRRQLVAIPSGQAHG